MSSTISAIQPDPSQVLTKAFLRAGRNLDLNGAELSVLLGVSPASLSRLSKNRTINPGSKEGELALLFLRLFRSLDSLVGGKEDPARAWLRAHNRDLNGSPYELIQSATGLVHVVDYLDAMRGR